MNYRYHFSTIPVQPLKPNELSADNPLGHYDSYLIQLPIEWQCDCGD